MSGHGRGHGELVGYRQPARLPHSVPRVPRLQAAGAVQIPIGGVHKPTPPHIKGG